MTLKIMHSPHSDDKLHSQEAYRRELELRYGKTKPTKKSLIVMVVKSGKRGD